MKGTKEKSRIIGKDDNISRKEAIVLAGKYAAFTATAMMMILNPIKVGSQPPSESPKPPRGSSVQKKARKKRTDPPPSY